MNILQISAPKTGSYWLHTILTKILKARQIPIDRFIQTRPEHQDLKQRDLSFKGQADIDMIDIEDSGCYYRVSSLFREPVEDLRTYADNTSLAWTHSTYCSNTSEVFRYFDKKVCIVRDPRDRALSSAKFAFTPYMQEHYPTSYSSPDDYLDGEYERLLEQWVWFYGNYLLHSEELDIHFVFYENLLHDFDREFNRLLNYLELSLDLQQREKLAEAVAFSSMKEKSPEHLQKGKYGKWVIQLSEARQELAIKKTGPLLELLNYPLSPEDRERMPSLPSKIPVHDLDELLKQINWQDLYV